MASFGTSGYGCHHGAMRLLVVCVVRQTGFLSRMMPPSELDPFLEAVDAANISAAFSFCGLDACDQSTPRMEDAIVRITPQRYGATRELRSVRSGRFGHQPAASEFCRKCGKSTTVDGLPVVREEALVSAVTEAMYDRMNGHGHHMELPTGYSVGPSDPKAWPFLTAFDDPKVYAMRELHALCEAHFMDPMDDSDALRDVMG
eukprot:jgi/Tetstr1/449772/TSEL_036836.t1